MYLLPQRGGQNRLFCLRRLIHVCKYCLSAHIMQFLKGHGGKSGHFAPVDESYSFGRNSSPCCAAAALNPDAQRGLFVLHVFAVATGAKLTLLPTSLDSRVQIRPFCTRQTIFELSRGHIVGFCTRRWIHVCRYGLFAHVVLH